MNRLAARSLSYLLALSLLGLTAAAAGTGCSASSGAARPDDQESGGAATGAEEGAGEAAADATIPYDAEANPVAVTAMRWHDGRLLVGFVDGGVADVDVMKRRVEVYELSGQAGPVVTFAPEAGLTLLDVQPPVVVNHEGDIILQMNPVEELESATFAPSGAELFVSDRSGKIRVWGQAHSFEPRHADEKLEDYLNRQAPDFHVQLAPARGPLVATENGVLLIGDEQGTISMWDPRRPSSSKRIMRLGAPIRSMESAAGYVVATATDGSLKVGQLDPPSFLPWSREERADYAALSPFYAERFLMVADGKLVSREISDGAVVWERQLPPGEPCGLELSRNGNLAAVCVGGQVGVVYTEDGRPESGLYRGEGGEGGELRWQDAQGQEIRP